MSGTTTHRPAAFPIDEKTRRACGSVQWLLENRHTTHPCTTDNVLQVLVCGQEAFAQIARDIEAAQHSIDLVCWGFDPGMELVRQRDSWPRGQPFGSLLDAAAGRGVQVRLLVWHEAGFAANVQNNLIGYTGDQREGYLTDTPTTAAEDRIAAGIPVPPDTLGGQDWRTPEQLRQDYCVNWWRSVGLTAQGKTPRRPGIEVRSRRGDKAKVVASLRGEGDQPKDDTTYLLVASEKSVIEDHATHHQKTILIDYAGDGGRNAVGYVMGLNSVTDYWDTGEHVFDTPLRETDWASKSDTAQALGPKHRVSRDPYRDYACRIQGPALRGVHRNFVDAWKRAGGALRPDDADTLPPKLARRACDWRAQVVRTQPEESDKTIKETYFHAVEFARDYLYIENQYFFYEPWVRHLKDKRRDFLEAYDASGGCQRHNKMLHVFAVIPWPENDGMVPRTYDMVKSLGEASSMPSQHQAMNEEAAVRKEWDDYMAQRSRIIERHRAARSDPGYELRALPMPTRRPAHDPVYDTAAKVQMPAKNPLSGELEGLGLKVLIARLVSRNRGKPLPKPQLNYRQVYIHSKLMVIDDSFFTLGSANMNQRSMAADSEINIATDDLAEARRLRKQVWGTLAGGFKATDGGDGRSAAVAKAFEDWKALMRKNKKALKEGTT